ncbi:hypothetical protein F5X96DRAFT_683434 [Biscogniauxia mediterranea]|nr:hypothetical protein F5X96DRAFT_683434 [Biscogniauxia mediterranea]
MADPSASDKTLLERLNALKPSSINIDAPAKPAPALAIEPAKPQSREDALANRLKNLREQSSDNKLAASPALALLHQDGDTIAPSAVVRATQPRLSSDGPHQGTAVLPTATSSALPAADDVDPLLETDDQTLEELLADLSSDQDWLDSVAAEEEEYQRVTSLLEELGKAPTTGENQAESDTAHKSGHDGGRDEDDDDDSEDDNSEGDAMTRETDMVLAQAVDEADWEKSNQPPDSNSALAPPDHEHETALTSRNHDTHGASNLDLPAVPSALQDQAADDDHLSEPPSPSPSSSADEDEDFAAVIASRMAALRVSPGPPELPAAPTADVDALGLPGVPTFAPAERSAFPAARVGYGYSDADQKTWCVVCLEDGGVRCLGCDGDVYCARCWKDMHVGPRAGYDERGHRWESFVRGGGR